VARLCGGRDDAALDRAEALVSLELAADTLERLQPVAQPRGILEAARVRQLGEPSPHARERTRRPLELVGVQGAGRELRAPP
jgi:hypothetical protein